MGRDEEEALMEAPRSGLNAAVASALLDRAHRMQSGAELVAGAREELGRRQPGSVTFRSARQAVRWYCEKSRLMRGPTAMHPRTERDRTGAEVRVCVDGGRGGDLHEVLVTMATIEKALESLYLVPASRLGRPSSVTPHQWHWMLLAAHGGLEERPPGWRPDAGRSGSWTQEDLAAKLQVSQRAVSEALGRAEDALSHVLRSGGVVR